MGKITFILLIFSFLNSFSQVDEKIFLNNHFRIGAGFNLMSSKQNLIKNNVDIISEINPTAFSKIGSLLDLRFTVNLNNRISINSGFQFINQSISIKYTGDWYKFSSNDFLIMDLSYLNIPFMFSYNTFYDKGYLDISAGISFSFEANKSSSTNSILLDNDNHNSNIELNINNNFDNKSANFQLEIGYNIPHENNNIMRIGVFYFLPFSSINLSKVTLIDKAPTESIYEVDIKANSFYGISVFYSFSFTNRIENYYNQANNSVEK